MAIQTSTGLRNAMLVTGSLKASLDGGEIRIYSGTAPDDADQNVNQNGTPTLLVTISLDGAGSGGLNLDTTANNGVVLKDPGQVWQGTNVANGTASFYRHVANTADDGATSTTAVRIQGDIDVAGSDMNLSNTNLTLGATQTINFYSLNLPTL